MIPENRDRRKVQSTTRYGNSSNNKIGRRDRIGVKALTLPNGSTPDTTWFKYCQEWSLDTAWPQNNKIFKNNKIKIIYINPPNAKCKVPMTCDSHYSFMKNYIYILCLSFKERQLYPIQHKPLNLHSELLWIMAHLHYFAAIKKCADTTLTFPSTLPHFRS